MPFGINIHLLCRRVGWQARHGEDAARESHDEAGPGGDTQFTHSDGKALGTAQLHGVIGKRILGLGHADRHLVKAQGLDFLQLLPSRGSKDDLVCPVNLLSNGGELFGDSLLRLRAE